MDEMGFGVFGGGFSGVNGYLFMSHKGNSRFPNI